MERKRFGKLGIFLVSLFFISLVLGIVAVIYGIRGGGAASLTPWGVTLDKNLVVKNVSEEGLFTKAGLRVGDIITRIDDVTVRRVLDLYVIIDGYKFGERFTLTLKRGDQGVVSTITVPRSIVGYLIVIFFPIVGFSLGLIGLIVYVKKPREEISTIFYLWFLTFMVMLFASVGVRVTLMLLLFNLTGLFTFNLFLHFTFIFPEKKGILKRRRNLLYVIYTPASIFSIVNIIGYIYYFYINQGLLATILSTVGTFSIFILLIIYLSLGLVSLVHSFKRTREPNDRRKIKLLVWSIVIVFTPILIAYTVFTGITLVGGYSNFNIYLSYMTLLSILLSILIPISIAYSIVKYNLFDIGRLIKRGIVYTILTILVTASYALITALLNIPLRNLEISRSPLFPIIFTLIIVFLFMPLRIRIQAFVDKVFFKTKYDFDKVVGQISETMTSLLNLDEILDNVIKVVMDTLQVRTSSVMLLTEGSNVYKVQRVSGEGSGNIEDMTFKREDHLVKNVEEKKGEISKYDIQGDPKYEAEREKYLGQFEELGATLVMPMVFKDQVMGLINVGDKKSEDLFTTQDLELLRILANQSAVSIENARLVEEVAQRERIKQELEVARNIQLSLLPQNDPQTPGFEIVGTSIPAEEVGGDFYSYHHLDGEKLGIAVGDVSGKGISAAMFMAVISGMIDSEAKENRSVSGLIRNVNHLLIPRAKPSKMNSALLYMILDTEEKRLRVANAGEIAPIVCRSDGSHCDYMDVKGFPVGMTTMGNYSEKELELESGDTVVLTSDGIVESMDGSGEMFGFDRLRDLVYHNRNLSAHDLSEKILDEVRSFVQSETSQDNVTMVVLKAR